MVARKFLVRLDDSTFTVDYDTDDGFEVSFSTNKIIFSLLSFIFSLELFSLLW